MSNVCLFLVHYRGLSAYVKEMAKLRIYAYLKYANVRFFVLKSTVNEARGTVQVEQVLILLYAVEI